MFRKWLIFAFLTCVCGPVLCRAQTYTATTCNAADVQSAYNLVAADGSIVQIPTGTCTWAVPVIPPCYSWTLQPVPGNTVNITMNIPSPTGFGSDAIFLDGCSGKSIRITGITWVNSKGDPAGIFYFHGGTGLSLRIDHGTYSFSPASGVTSGRVGWINMPCAAPGCVVDHNSITNLDFTVASELSADASLNAPGSSTTCASLGGADNCAGGTEWNQPMVFDNGSEVYFENNTYTFTNTYANNDMMDCELGGRYVFRYNTVNGNQIFGHGWDSVATSCLEIDAYKNTIDGASQAQANILFRGGAGVLYQNILKNSTAGPMLLTNYRSSNNGGLFITPPSCVTKTGGICNYCGDSTPNPADANVTNGYACFEQPGRGSGTNSFLGGSTTFSYPIYEWDNCKTALGCTGTGDQDLISIFTAYAGTPDYTSNDIQQNRDYYDSQNSACTGTQATGVCIGLLSARATTCTSGVGYWATDHSTLYQCGAGNTWSIYYTPYTYPHPLDTGSQAIVPSCTPGSGSNPVSITVTCTNPNSGTTVMCYTENGTTPVTNGAGTGCTTGTIVTSTIVITVTVTTLNVVAGTSLLPDSNLVSYGPYTISGSPSGADSITGAVCRGCEVR